MRDVLIFFILTSLTASCLAYKHVIFMHGLLAGKDEVTHFLEFVEKYHPGTQITIIDDFNYVSSLRPLWKQVEKIRQEMDQVMRNNPDGVHLVCFSQGGLICRGVLETLSSHNVINFISLSSPQAGQFGDSRYLSPYVPEVFVKELYRILYTKRGQSLSIANYWNDPHHQDLYRQWSAFLAVVNNQSSNTSQHHFSTLYKENFVRLKNLIVVGGPDDGVITPWQSSHFGMYNDKEEVIGYQQQAWYREDWFGLKSLDQKGALHVYTVAGVHHTSWHKNITVFKQCIEPWLT